MDWLVCSTDPFHDTDVALAGYPDMNTSKSITQVVQRSATITSGTDPWDCHMFFLPTSGDLNSAPTAKGDSVLQLYSIDNYNRLNGSVSGGPFIGGLNVVPVNTSDPWSSGSATLGLGIPASYCKGKHRLVGVAYEVVNVTAPLYKQGAVWCYKQPNQTTIGTSTLAIGSPTDIVTKIASLPPANEAEVALYPNARTWEAAEGAYVIQTLSDIENPPLRVVPHAYLATNMDYNVASPSQLAMYSWGGVANTRPAAVEYPFDNCGSLFVGLSPQTSLKVTVRYLFERFPTQNDPDLLVLARPPTPYDPLALELYARALHEMPCYVMVKENPMGEWFSRVLEMVGQVAPVVGKVLPFPGAALIGDVVGKGAGAVAKALQPPKNASVLGASPQASSSGSKKVSKKPKRKK